MSTLYTLARRVALPFLLVGALLAFEGCMMARRAPANPRTGGGTSVILLQNRTADPIYYVYISPCQSTSWGSDRLNTSEVVMPGASRTFQMTPGCWDLKAQFRDGREVEERQVYMTAGGSRTWTLSR